jgi:hypothetical protein
LLYCPSPRLLGRALSYNLCLSVIDAVQEDNKVKTQ